MKASAALAALLDPDNRIGSKVTVQEGLRQSAALRELAESGDLKLAQLTAAAKDWRALGLPGYAHRRAEGFLFPATYDVEPDTTAAGLLAEMVAQFDQVATEINLENRAREVGLDPYQAVIVASLIQAEARHAEDFPKVARVIYDRLNQDMRLQLDSAVHYAVGKSGVVTTTAEDRASPSPYNTYRHEGLPPGPINSPGQAALEAALHPAKGAWLYFVTVNPDTGETKFATTAAQHAVNVQELREWLRDHWPAAQRAGRAADRPGGAGRDPGRAADRPGGAGRGAARGGARLADRALTVAGAAPGRVRRARPGLALRRVRSGRCGAARIPVRSGRALGGPVADHAAQAGGAAAVRAAESGRRRGGRGQYRPLVAGPFPDRREHRCARTGGGARVGRRVRGSGADRGARRRGHRGVGSGRGRAAGGCLGPARAGPPGAGEVGRAGSAGRGVCARPAPGAGAGCRCGPGGRGRDHPAVAGAPKRARRRSGDLDGPGGRLRGDRGGRPGPSARTAVRRGLSPVADSAGGGVGSRRRRSRRRARAPGPAGRASDRADDRASRSGRAPGPGADRGRRTGAGRLAGRTRGAARRRAGRSNARRGAAAGSGRTRGHGAGGARRRPMPAGSSAPSRCGWPVRSRPSCAWPALMLAPCWPRWCRSVCSGWLSAVTCRVSSSGCRPASRSW